MRNMLEFSKKMWLMFFNGQHLNMCHMNIIALIEQAKTHFVHVKKYPALKSLNVPAPPDK